MVKIALTVTRDTGGVCEARGCHGRSVVRIPVYHQPRYLCQLHLMTLWMFASKEIAQTDVGELLGIDPPV
jgi:hypothetical protein